MEKFKEGIEAVPLKTDTGELNDEKLIMEREWLELATQLYDVWNEVILYYMMRQEFFFTPRKKRGVLQS